MVLFQASRKSLLPHRSVKDIYKHHSIFALKSSTKSHKSVFSLSITDTHDDQHYLHILGELNAFKESALKKGHNYLHLGYLVVGVVPLFRSGLNVSCMGSLLDTRPQNPSDRVVPVIEGPLSDGPIHMECYPNLLIALADPNFAQTVTFMFRTSGLNMKRGSHHVHLAYRLIVKTVSTNLPSVYDGLSIKDGQDDKGQNMLSSSSVNTGNLSSDSNIQQKLELGNSDSNLVPATSKGSLLSPLEEVLNWQSNSIQDLTQMIQQLQSQLQSTLTSLVALRESHDSLATTIKSQIFGKGQGESSSSSKSNELHKEYSSEPELLPLERATQKEELQSGEKKKKSKGEAPEVLCCESTAPMNQPQISLPTFLASETYPVGRE